MNSMRKNWAFSGKYKENCLAMGRESKNLRARALCKVQVIILCMLTSHTLAAIILPKELGAPNKTLLYSFEHGGN